MEADTTFPKSSGERERPSPEIHDFILNTKRYIYPQNSEPQTRPLVETSFRVAQILTIIGSQITNPQPTSKRNQHVKLSPI